MAENSSHVATIVLAAGFSSRTGTAFKPLLRLGGLTVIERTIKTHLDAGIHDIRVVAGHRADEVAEAVGRLGVGVLVNPHFAKGMFSSIQAGVASLEAGVPAFFIMPADMPLVRPETVKAVLNAHAGCAYGIAFPVCRGRRGHPPLLARKYIPEILESRAPDGLRGILKNHEAEARGVEVDDEGILLDLDTIEDYYRLLDHGKE